MQKRKICRQLLKNWIVGWVWFLCVFLHFYNKMNHEARHLPSLCRLNLLKVVCIRAISNTSRMLLQLKLLKIPFWREKKQLNTFAFFTQHWDYSWFFFCTNDLIQSCSEKSFRNSHLFVTQTRYAFIQKLLEVQKRFLIRTWVVQRCSQRKRS